MIFNKPICLSILFMVSLIILSIILGIDTQANELYTGVSLNTLEMNWINNELVALHNSIVIEPLGIDPLPKLKQGFGFSLLLEPALFDLGIEAEFLTSSVSTSGSFENDLVCVMIYPSPCPPNSPSIITELETHMEVKAYGVSLVLPIEIETNQIDILFTGGLGYFRGQLQDYRRWHSEGEPDSIQEKIKRGGGLGVKAGVDLKIHLFKRLSLRGGLGYRKLEINSLFSEGNPTQGELDFSGYEFSAGFGLEL